MAINFDSLSNSSKGFGLPKAGTYKATIDTAEMKKGRDLAKPPYLNLKLKLENEEGKFVGNIFDILAESETSLMKYKLKRFLNALGLVFQGDFELKDVQKVCAGKELIVDIKIEKGTDGRQDRAVVDIAKDIYYPMSQAEEIFGTTTTTTNTVINANDAEDAVTNDIEDEF